MSVGDRTSQKSPRRAPATGATTPEAGTTDVAQLDAQTDRAPTGRQTRILT